MFVDPITIEPLPVLEFMNAIVLACSCACVVGALAFFAAEWRPDAAGEDAAPAKA